MLQLAVVVRLTLQQLLHLKLIPENGLNLMHTLGRGQQQEY
jgi:hypothetical protein